MYKAMVTLPEAIVLPTTITGQQSLDVSIMTGSALRVFNGDKFRLREAPEIELKQGEERTDIDFLIPTTGLRTLSGFVTRQTDQQAIRAGTVRLLDPGDRSELRETAFQEGSFTFDYIPDGSYLIEIEPDNSDSYAPLTAPLVVASDLPDLNFAIKKQIR
jgi:hypothetical protein